MGLLTYSRSLIAGTPENVADVQAMFDEVRALVNGNLDASNLAAGAVDSAELAASLASYLGVSANGVTRRGKFIQAAEGTRTNAAYGALSNGPDVASSIVHPTDGLMVVAYDAEWKESVAADARAAIFVGANQLRCRAQAIDWTGAAQAAVLTRSSGVQATNKYTPLQSWPLGLVSRAPQSGDVDADGSTTAPMAIGAALRDAGPGGCVYIDLGGTQVDVNNNSDGAYAAHYFGGLCLLYAPAGTYDVSVQYKAATGTVSARKRKLWAMSLAF